MNHEHTPAGAKQPHIFSHERADVLDDPEREQWLPTQTLVALLDVGSGMRVLDFGAGTGRYAIPVAKTHRDARVTAYDVQPEFVALVTQRSRDAALSNLTATQTLGEAYDRILAANVLHEIGDDDLAAMRTALAPGGIALIIDWDSGIDRPTGPPREHAHTQAEALQRLQRAGFTHITKIEEPKLPYHFIYAASRR